MKLICDVPKQLYENILTDLTHNPYDMEGNDAVNFRTTELLDPPLIRSLWYDNLVKDELVLYASEFVFMQFGTAFHMLLEGEDTDTEKYEYRMSLKIGETIEGRSINLYGTMDEINISDVAVQIIDNKVSNVFVMSKPLKTGHNEQVNVYRYLLSCQDDFAGMEINQLFIRYFLRDWVKTQTVRKDYPSTPIGMKQAEIMSFEDVENLITTKATDHIENPYRDCTPEERTFKIVYKIKYPERDKALISTYTNEKGIPKCDIETYEKALELLQTVNPKYSDKAYIEKVGNDARCKMYCKVRSVCPYAKEKGYL